MCIRFLPKRPHDRNGHEVYNAFITKYIFFNGCKCFTRIVYGHKICWSNAMSKCLDVSNWESMVTCDVTYSITSRLSSIVACYRLKMTGKTLKCLESNYCLQFAVQLECEALHSKSLHRCRDTESGRKYQSSNDLTWTFNRTLAITTVRAGSNPYRACMLCYCRSNAASHHDEAGLRIH